MHRMSAFVIVIFFMLMAGAASAQQEGTPVGPYQQSCNEVSVKKGSLYAKCQDEKGKYHSTRLSDYARCSSDNTNKNGNLECAHEGNAASNLPIGSYNETCKDIRMKGTTLHAVCKSNDGRELPTSLREANRCMDGVVNLNGILTCQVNDVLPPGSYISTCKDIRMKGTTLYASCNNGKDQWLNAEMHQANQCTGDIANQNGALRCTPFRTMERR